MKTPTTTTDPKLYIGLDIHKRSWKIHTATDIADGRSFSSPPDPDALWSYVSSRFPEYEVFIAYEAGCCGFEPHRAFEAFGWNSLVVNPADIFRPGSKQYCKTDKIDARLICRELKDSRLQSIDIPDRKREEFRALFRQRCKFVNDMRRVKSRIKMQLLFLGIDIPEGLDSPKWTKKFVAWLQSIECYYTTGTKVFKNHVSQYLATKELIRTISNDLRAYCRNHFKKDYNLLRSIPGIGPMVACGILAELGDLRQYKSAKKFAAYVGFMPRIYQSADTEKSFGITPRAQRIIRSYFIEASWQAIRFDPSMQDYYRKHAGKDSKKIIVKVARKLLLRARAVVISGEPYKINYKKKKIKA